MAFTRPVKKDDPVVKPTADEKKIEALINKGGSATRKGDQQPDSEDGKHPIRLIPYTSQLRDIERVISQLPERKRPSRHAYILQAIDEKLQRDKRKLK